jgi:MoxR-like ATPase
MTTQASITYGAPLDARALERTLGHVFRANLRNEEQGRTAMSRGTRPTPICIWGSHGIGKTAVVKAFAERNGWKFRYCAPAQFEEMGDLHGLPVRHDPDESMTGDETTIYMPPEWVPKEGDDGPGILLLDDINRADDRILRGIMQLLQEFEMFSWTLPPKWQIVCTANPEGGDYTVTTMDDAMVTRMLHFTMVYDLQSWVQWASAEGVDARGIAFILSYPEAVTGKRTTPRSLTQFFDQIRSIPDLSQDLELVMALAKSALDDITATVFATFVRDNLSRLIEPEEILDASDWAVVSARISAAARGEGGAVRVDRLSTMCSRLHLHVARAGFWPKGPQARNLEEFLLHPDLPLDLRTSLHRDLTALGGEAAAAVRTPRVAKAILGGR